MVDAKGNVAAYTGPKCIPDAGHLTGDQFTVEANLMSNPSIWPAMKSAFEKADGDLAERMLKALEAAEKAGGDIRGRQSAAILVVRGQSSGKPWMDKLVRSARGGLARSAQGAAPADAAAPRLQPRGPGRQLHRGEEAGRGDEGVRRSRQARRRTWSSSSSGPRSRCTPTSASPKASSSFTRCSRRSPLGGADPAAREGRPVPRRSEADPGRGEPEAQVASRSLHALTTAWRPPRSRARPLGVSPRVLDRERGRAVRARRLLRHLHRAPHLPLARGRALATCRPGSWRACSAR